MYKFISYGLMHYEIDLADTFADTGDRMAVKEFKDFLNEKLHCNEKYTEEDLLDIIDDLTKRHKDINYDELYSNLRPFMKYEKKAM